uniref:Uncharacterized protein n=1 Tax=Eutreptiella gymnastica TaxID=73025 RepID=A0A7S4LFK5_9EUGL
MAEHDDRDLQDNNYLDDEDGNVAPGNTIEELYTAVCAERDALQRHASQLERELAKVTKRLHAEHEELLAENERLKKQALDQASQSAAAGAATAPSDECPED